MEALKNAHAIWVYVVLIMGGIAIGQMWRGMRRREEWRPIDQNIGSFFVTALDLEMVLGILLWIFQGRWDGLETLQSFRHPGLMLAAWTAVRFGWLRVSQTGEPQSKFTRAFIFFTIGGLIMMGGIFQIYGVF